MCSWERFCTFAREPERRKVGIDARISVEGIFYEVEPDLAGETVILWWGLFDNELYVERGERRYGPYLPVGSPIPLDRYRSFKKTRTQQRADRIEALAKQLALPGKSGAVPVEAPRGKIIDFPRLGFVDPDPFGEFSFPTKVAAKKAIADYLRKPLAKLTPEQMAYVNEVKDFKPPTGPETRERKLLELMQKRRTPVALFVDDAHDLHPRTLIGLKRLIELVRLDGNGTPLSIVLAGHPKLKNDLRRPSLEEIGGRATVFSLEGIRGHQREYIEWVLNQASGSSVEPTELLSEEALTLLATRLSTALQIEQYLTLAFEEAYGIGQKPVTLEVIETVLAQGLDDLEPHLTRNGYNAKVLAERLNVRAAEVRSFLQGQLPPGRTQDLREKMLKVGIPV